MFLPEVDLFFVGFDSFFDLFDFVDRPPFDLPRLLCHKWLSAIASTKNVRKSVRKKVVRKKSHEQI